MIVTSVKSIGRIPLELSITIDTSARPSAGRFALYAGEHDVVHLLATNSSRTLCAEHPSDRVDDVALARAVRANNNGHAWFEVENRRVGEALEAFHRQRLEEHGSRFSFLVSDQQQSFEVPTGP